MNLSNPDAFWMWYTAYANRKAALFPVNSGSQLTPTFCFFCSHLHHYLLTEKQSYGHQEVRFLPPFKWHWCGTDRWNSFRTSSKRAFPAQFCPTFSQLWVTKVRILSACGMNFTRIVGDTMTEHPGIVKMHMLKRRPFLMEFNIWTVTSPISSHIKLHLLSVVKSSSERWCCLILFHTLLYMFCTFTVQ